MAINEMKQLESNGLKVVDLFCGAGVGACGFKTAGFDIVWGIDNNKYAVDTYNRNIGNHAICQDIKTLDYSVIPEHDIMVSTPTCKSFSWAGKRDGFDNTTHGDLIFYFYDILKYHRPKAFLFENVDGLVSKKNLPIFDTFLKDVECLGYQITWDVKDVYNYGVPQHRKRVFAVGIRNDFKKKYTFPNEVDELEKKTVRDAIGDLPHPEFTKNSSKNVQFINPNPDLTIKNHYGYGIRNDEKPFVDKIPVKGNVSDLPLQDAISFLKGAYKPGMNITKGSGFLRKLDFDKPSHTITSIMNGKMNAQIVDNRDKYLDFKVGQGIPMCRRLTVRECLRLQSVPDWFSFENTVTLEKQYERCSGIPSLMAYKLILSIKDIIS